MEQTNAIAANAENKSKFENATSKGQVKFVSNFLEFYFMLPVLDADGKPAFVRHPNSNAKVYESVKYSFTKVPSQRARDGAIGRTKDGKPALVTQANTAYCYFIADPDVHGTDFDRIVKLLSDMCKNPKYKMFTEDDHFARRNPEAYRIAKEKVEVEAKLSAKDKEIDELKERLGFKKR